MSKAPDSSSPQDPVDLIDASLLELLICPVTGSSLSLSGDFLVSACGEFRYPFKNGIAVLVPQTSVSSAKNPDKAVTDD